MGKWVLRWSLVVEGIGMFLVAVSAFHYDAVVFGLGMLCILAPLFLGAFWIVAKVGSRL